MRSKDLLSQFYMVSLNRLFSYHEWPGPPDILLISLTVECRLTPLKPGGPRPHLHNHLSQNIIAYIQQIESPLLIDTDLDLEEWGNEAIMRNVEKVFYSETSEFRSVLLLYSITDRES